MKTICVSLPGAQKVVGGSPSGRKEGIAPSTEQIKDKELKKAMRKSWREAPRKEKKGSDVQGTEARTCYEEQNRPQPQ